jgi:hypothetical protein
MNDDSRHAQYVMVYSYIASKHIIWLSGYNTSKKKRLGPDPSSTLNEPLNGLTLGQQHHYNSIQLHNQNIKG